MMKDIADSYIAYMYNYESWNLTSELVDELYESYEAQYNEHPLEPMFQRELVQRMAEIISDKRSVRQVFRSILITGSKTIASSMEIVCNI